MSKKKHAFGVRIDGDTYEQLEKLAAATERSKGAIVRLLIRYAAEMGFREVRVLPADRARREVEHE
jgi:predicted transcriptional regulator